MPIQGEPLPPKSGPKIPGWVPTVVGAGIGLYTARAANANAAKEAQKNRDFQERMSNTAHQREVDDLRAAGLNTMLAVNGGASSPSGSMAQVRDTGEGVSRAIASALAVKQAKANIDLTYAQAASANATAQESNVRATDMVTTGRLGRHAEITTRAQMATLDLEQKRELFPTLKARALEEVRLTANSADRAALTAMLEELSLPGAENLAAFEKKAGQLGPATKLLVDLVRLYNMSKNGGR